METNSINQSSIGGVSGFSEVEGARQPETGVVDPDTTSRLQSGKLGSSPGSVPQSKDRNQPTGIRQKLDLEPMQQRSFTPSRKSEQAAEFVASLVAFPFQVVSKFLSALLDPALDRHSDDSSRKGPNRGPIDPMKGGTVTKYEASFSPEAMDLINQGKSTPSKQDSVTRTGPTNKGVEQEGTSDVSNSPVEEQYEGASAPIIDETEIQQSSIHPPSNQKEGIPDQDFGGGKTGPVTNAE